MVVDKEYSNMFQNVITRIVARDIHGYTQPQRLEQGRLTSGIVSWWQRLREVKGQCDELRRYTVLLPDGQLVVMCYHRLSEFIQASIAAACSEEDTCIQS